MKKKRRYTRVFSIPEKAQKALSMLKAGDSYAVVAKEIGCDKTSVMYFYKKKLREGLSLQNFNGVTVEIVGEFEIDLEKINPGKNYKDYVKKYDKEKKKFQRVLMKEAKKTISKVRKYRKDNDLVNEEVWDF